jgi:signal transduction histidine kinase
MSFRRRLLLLFALLVIVSVAAVTLIVSAMARRAFDRANDERTSALVGQFRQEFSRRGEDVARRVQAAAVSPEAAHIAVAAAQTSPNYNAFLDDAQTVAQAQRLDFLEFCDDRGTIISSAQWPAKFGYNDPLASVNTPASPFLKNEEIPGGSELGLFAVRTTAAGDRKVYLIGGVRLDRSFLSSLDLPAGMRVMLYEGDATKGLSPAQMITIGGPTNESPQLAPLITRVRNEGRDATGIVHSNAGLDETVNAFPLFGANNDVLAVLLVASSRQIYVDLRNQIRSAALLASATGLFLAILLSSWAAARVTRPIEKLAHASQEVASGNWTANVDIASQDEIGELADSFNRMTRELREQQERLMQAERVAAWREVARRLAHELKNPLFPLQLTVENLLRAREGSPHQFDETFRESAATLLSEISNLKSIVAHFSDFSKMPQPHFEPVRLDEMIQNVTKAHQAQLEKARISSHSELSASEPIAADPDLLHRAISNLVLNAVDAMPQGGTLTLRTGEQQGGVRIEVADTGVGIKPEERDRLFTPYYTSKAHGTGLGLAIVQSIVSDHGGRISVESVSGQGTTFIIELPSNLDKLSSSQATNA